MGATESNQGVVKRESYRASAGKNLFQEGFSVAMTAAGDGELDHGEVGGGIVGVAALCGGPPENIVS